LHALRNDILDNEVKEKQQQRPFRWRRQLEDVSKVGCTEEKQSVTQTSLYAATVNKQPRGFTAASP
jgi:hypothetical protein